MNATCPNGIPNCPCTWPRLPTTSGREARTTAKASVPRSRVPNPPAPGRRLPAMSALDQRTADGDR